MKLTPQEKEFKRKRDNLTLFHNRLANKISFGQIKTWTDYYREAGLPKGPNDGPFTRDDFKHIKEEQQHELERELEGRREAVSISNAPAETTTTPRRLEVSTATVQISPAPSETRAQPIRDEPSPSKVVDVIIDQVYNEQNNYGLVDSPNEHVDHFWFQKKAIAQTLHKIHVEKRHGLLIIAQTGSGKTFISFGTLRRLADESFHEGKTWSHIPYLYVTRASIVTQTERVGQEKYKMDAGAGVEVINIEQLRSTAGRLWVKETMEVVNGQEEYKWQWKKNINPCVIVWDECQALKNDGSTQHKIAAAYNELTSDTYQLFVSATPFTRVSEAKCWAVSTRRNIEHLGFPKGTVLSNETWPAYSAAIAAPSKPDEYNEAAVERLMKDLDDYVVSVKGIRPQFDAINIPESIQFKTDEERKYYHEAWNRYIDEKAKLDAIRMAEGKATNGINELVAFQKFRMAAEYCRREHLAEQMYDIVQNKKKAAVCALNFKGSIIAVVKILVEKYKVPRDQISLIWGGGQTQLTKKQKDKQKIIGLKDKFEAMGMSAEEMLESLGLDEVEDRIIEEFDKSLKLGPQSPEERQREIDRFQSGKSLYCLFTFRAGGVGLSLHHTDEFTNTWNESTPGYEEWRKEIDEWNAHKKPENQVKPGKCRRKDSGYVFEEDIPFIPVRPRELISSVTYSAIELVQGLGRCPRLTSLSNTLQRLLHYTNTIEDDVKEIVSRKLRCLSKVVRNREKWMDVVMAQSDSERSSLTQEHIDAVPAEETGEQPEMVTVGDSDL